MKQKSKAKAPSAFEERADAYVAEGKAERGVLAAADRFARAWGKSQPAEIAAASELVVAVEVLRGMRKRSARHERAGVRRAVR